MLKKIKENIRSIAFLERIIAFAIDLAIALSLSILPSFGWILCLCYFLWRDSLPFSKKQSFGKSIYHLKVVEETGTEYYALSKEKAFIRNMIVLIPFLNLMDGYQFLLSGQRLADRWTQTKVIKISAPENHSVRSN